MSRASGSSERRYVAYQSPRLQAQQSTRGEALLVVVTIVAALVAAAAVGSATWARFSISLQIIDDVGGQWARREPEHRQVGAIPDADPVCATKLPETFADEFNSLSQAIGDTMGQPLDCPHADAATGDVLQPTSTGLAVYRARSHVAIFTDGYRHWALGRHGLVTWEGDAVDPPA